MTVSSVDCVRNISQFAVRLFIHLTTEHKQHRFPDDIVVDGTQTTPFPGRRTNTSSSTEHKQHRFPDDGQTHRRRRNRFPDEFASARAGLVSARFPLFRFARMQGRDSISKHTEEMF